MACRAPSQFLRHLLEGALVESLPAALETLLEGVDLKLSCGDELVDVQFAVSERGIAGLRGELPGITLARAMLSL